jgi:hypothetical protein
MTLAKVTVENVEQVQSACLAYSRKNPRLYVTAKVVFGVCFIYGETRLNVFAPSDCSDSTGGLYWLNGMGKRFTTKQVIADQNATPLLS